MFICRFTSNLFENGLGFQLEYEPSDVTHWSYNSGACGGTFKTPNGILTSPSHPNFYPEQADCVYLISQPNGTNVNISFLSMDIDCQGTPSDYIEMRDGNSEDSPLMIRFCGKEGDLPAFMQTTQNHLRIR